MRKAPKFWINGLVGIVMIVLIMVMSLFIIDYHGSVNHGYVSLYGYIENSGKQTSTIDRELAVMQIDQTNNGSYPSKLIISNERTHRTQTSQFFSTLLVVVGIVFIISILFELAFEIISMFDYYNRKSKIYCLILRTVVFALSVVIAIAVPFYLGALAPGLELYFSFGFGTALLPVISFINIVLYHFLSRE
ncbi:MAG: hypothetical protein IJS68_04085 [Clostridia bacterium]|nr:hypothetical protein [Clostridia bacterium]